MSQSPEMLFDNMPCPECGSTHLIQHVRQSEDVHVDENGDIDYIDPRDTVDVEELWCPECDEKIWESDE